MADSIGEVLVKCVPNFSHGRDPSVVEMIAQAMREPANAYVLAWEWDEDHNRSVITAVGTPQAIVESGVRGIREGIRHIDPRVGAADVIPFVPLKGITLDACADLAVEAGERIWNELKIPVYLYGAAARRIERRELGNIRKGGFEKLAREALTNPDRAPDIGGPGRHSSAGACIVGARKALLAFNINLDTQALKIAQAIAREIREANGGFRCVRALGVALASRGLTQVTMNLTDYTETGLEEVYSAVHRLAKARDVEIVESEMIGLFPKAALPRSPKETLKMTNFDESRVLETRLSSVLGVETPVE